MADETAATEPPSAHSEASPADPRALEARPGIAAFVATVFAIANVLPFHAFASLWHTECEQAVGVHRECGLAPLYFLPLLPFAGIGLFWSVVLAVKILQGKVPVTRRGWWTAAQLGAWGLIPISLLYCAAAMGFNAELTVLQQQAITVLAFVAWWTTVVVVVRLLIGPRK